MADTHSDSGWETDEWEVLSVSSNTTSTASTIASSWEEVSVDTVVLADDASGHKRKLLEVIEEESDYVYDSDDDAVCLPSHNTTVYDEKLRLTRAIVDSALEAGPPPLKARTDETLAHELASVDKSDVPSSRINVDQELAIALQDEEDAWALLQFQPQHPRTGHPDLYALPSDQTRTHTTARTPWYSKPTHTTAHAPWGSKPTHTTAHAPWGSKPARTTAHAPWDSKPTLTNTYAHWPSMHTCADTTSGHEIQQRDDKSEDVENERAHGCEQKNQEWADKSEHVKNERAHGSTHVNKARAGESGHVKWAQPLEDMDWAKRWAKPGEERWMKSEAQDATFCELKNFRWTKEEQCEPDNLGEPLHELHVVPPSPPRSPTASFFN